MRNFYIVFFLLFASRALFAQSWELTYEPNRHGILEITSIDNVMYATGQYVNFRSYDQGRTWEEIKPLHGASKKFFKLGNTLFAVGYNLVRSDDNGLTWNVVQINYKSYHDAAVANGKIYVTSNEDVLCSADTGRTWRSITGNLPVSYNSDIEVMGDELFYTHYDNGIYKTSDNGITWVQVHPEWPGSGVRKLITDGTSLFAYQGYEIYVTRDRGATWQNASAVLPNDVYCTYSTLTIHNGKVYLPASNGYYVSDASNLNWTYMGTPEAEATAYSIFFSGSNVYAGTQHGLFHSADNGSTWARSNSGITVNNRPTGLAWNNGVLWAAGECLYRSDDNAQTWKQVFTGSLRKVAAKGNVVFAANEYSAAISADNGATWKSTILPSGHGEICAIDIAGQTLYALARERLYKSTDLGQTWKTILVDDGLQYSFYNGMYFDDRSGTLYISGNRSVYATTNHAASWLTRSAGLEDVTFSLDNDNSFCRAGDHLYFVLNDKVFRYDEANTQWIPVNDGLPGGAVPKHLRSKGEKLIASCIRSAYMGTAYIGLYILDAQSGRWSVLDTSMAGNAYYFSFEVGNDYMFGGANNFGVMRKAIDQSLDISASGWEAPCISISPNPASSIIGIEVPAQMKITSIKLFDMHGKEVFTSPDPLMRSIDVSHLQGGTYLLHFSSGGRSEIKKVVVR